jgi:hypothetical protein
MTAVYNIRDYQATPHHARPISAQLKTLRKDIESTVYEGIRHLIATTHGKCGDFVSGGLVYGLRSQGGLIKPCYECVCVCNAMFSKDPREHPYIRVSDPQDALNVLGYNLECLLAQANRIELMELKAYVIDLTFNNCSYKVRFQNGVRLFGDDADDTDDDDNDFEGSIEL